MLDRIAAPHATPQQVQNSFTGATGVIEAAESAIWSFRDGAGGVLQAQWIDGDGCESLLSLLLYTYLNEWSGSDTGNDDRLCPWRGSVCTPRRLAGIRGPVRECRRGRKYFSPFVIARHLLKATADVYFRVLSF